jgi:hypothetical protein
LGVSWIITGDRSGKFIQGVRSDLVSFSITGRHDESGRYYDRAKDG